MSLQPAQRNPQNGFNGMLSPKDVGWKLYSSLNHGGSRGNVLIMQGLAWMLSKSVTVNPDFATATPTALMVDFHRVIRVLRGQCVSLPL